MIKSDKVFKKSSEDVDHVQKAYMYIYSYVIR